MILARLFRRRDVAAAAHDLYGASVARAREPVFYRDLSVPDTLEGRFEMIALHVFLILRRLRRDRARGGGDDGSLGQALFDLMFADMDRSLREMGAGDLGVGRRVKAMAEAFYGRINAYDAGLDADGDAALVGAIARNVYGAGGAGDAAGDGGAEAGILARYMRRSDAVLAAQPGTDIAAGGARFAPLPGTAL